MEEEAGVCPCTVLAHAQGHAVGPARGPTCDTTSSPAGRAKTRVGANVVHLEEQGSCLLRVARLDVS